MKKIIAIVVILAGVVLLTIGNTIQMYSTISIIEKRLADKEHVVDTVDVKEDSMSFEEERAIAINLINKQKVYKGDEHVPNVEFVEGKSNPYQTLIWYKNGMPKIVAPVSRDKKSGEARIYGWFSKYLGEDGRIIARANNKELTEWLCYGIDSENAFVLRDPNLCRNLKLN